LLHLVGCLHRCAGDARSHKHKVVASCWLLTSLCWWCTVTKTSGCCILLVACIVVLVMHGHTNIKLLHLVGCLHRWNGRVWSGFIGLQTGTSVELLCRLQWTFGFHKIRKIYWLANDVLWVLKNVQQIPRSMREIESFFTCSKILTSSSRNTAAIYRYWFWG
jgi:hypothetical protein